MQDGVPTRSIPNRLDVIADLVRDREVLDLGVVDARVARGNAEERFERTGKILFFELAEINPNIVGLDLDSEGVEVLKQRGYNAVCGDVHVVDLDRKFDTIIAGEIIEHLDNPGQFLCNMFRHLKPGGRLVVSTPNPFYAKQRGKIWRHGLPQVHEEHTCWFDPITLNHLLNRSGFTTLESYWINPHGQFIKTWPRKLRGYFSHSFMMIATQSEE
ncbi:MAG: class I SAM-dependent methyltransferase [Verrucomicrobiota bacterium]|nr:class I SAM-dependent methyltransferase [Verrucomicrobiota bacterium]|tara:strand:+ start:284 stop:928 length:645 start_codon:yes stop_codon:yes gene_type:complete